MKKSIVKRVQNMSIFEDNEERTRLARQYTTQYGGGAAADSLESVQGGAYDTPTYQYQVRGTVGAW